ncbi:hypothetical protein V6N12_035553 [Hibiscus sabdariffa]|uniref:Uncharacterized protein n=1 Tax=Hibiscus sabdariffa TaxID=183260 RepID=A0ABR2ENG6_9ROSI
MVFSIVVQEAELVWVLAIEQQEVVECTDLGDKSHEVKCGFTWLSFVGGKGGWGGGWMWLCHLVGTQNQLWGLEHNGRDHVVSIELAGGTEWVVCDRERVLSTSAMLDDDGGARKVKLVTSFVEALGSPAQQCVITTARNRRGRGRMTQVNCLVKAGGDVESKLEVISRDVVLWL